MKVRQGRARHGLIGGFSLIEVTFAMTQTLALAATVVLLLGQHVSFLRIVNRFGFLRDEAPAINVLLGRILRQTDSYRVYPSKAAAIAGTGAVTRDGSAVWLRFRNPDGSFEQAMIAFEAGEGHPGLNYYLLAGPNWSSEPEWTLSSLPQNVTFANDSGILLVTVTGQNGEEITYAGGTE